MKEFFSGDILYGDDFNSKQIKLWHNQEKEAYANLKDNKDRTLYKYVYHAFNQFHAFSKCKNIYFKNVLGIGSAYGDEFLPIIDQIEELTIVEPSKKFLLNSIGAIQPKYIAPEITGKINMGDNQFDLITCLGVLHHIPNVTFVLKEIIRVLQPGGILLLREPISSMGDWRKERIGLTKNERGISVQFFENLFANNNIEVISKNYCLTAPVVFSNIFGRVFKKPLVLYKWYVLFDFLISKILRFNSKYHKVSLWDKASPRAVYFVLKKK